MPIDPTIRMHQDHKGQTRDEATTTTEEEGIEEEAHRAVAIGEVSAVKIIPTGDAFHPSQFLILDSDSTTNIFLRHLQVSRAVTLHWTFTW